MDGYILVVDDNADVRELMRQMIDAMSITVRLANDGDQALKAVRDEVPRLILLDLMMPEMNGFTVISHLQKEASLRKIPVIVLSSLDVSSTNLAKIPSIYHTIQKGSLEFLQIRDRIREILDTKEDPKTPNSPDK